MVWGEEKLQGCERKGTKMSHRLNKAFAVMMIILMVVSINAKAADIPPKGKTTTVTCVDNPSIKYPVYVSKFYDPEKPAIFILTFSAGGGGMVSTHVALDSKELPVIIAGCKSSRNGATLASYIGEFML